MQTCAFRGSKSRNKVTVGEPAVGSLKSVPHYNPCEPFLNHASSGSTAVVAVQMVAEEKMWCFLSYVLLRCHSFNREDLSLRFNFHL
jgi:hypothetical protein